MNIIQNLFTSSLGKKYLMALTGLALFFFVIGHMVGNLQIFAGRETLNAYAHFLKSKPLLLWGARLGLLACVAIHIWTAIRLTQENRAARPVQYAKAKPYAASYASRTMIWSGLIIAVFIVYHLLHFTVGVTHPEHFKLVDANGHHDVYGMVVKGFQSPLVSGFYVLAMGLLCLHLSHGVSALFQSLGLKNKAYGPLIDKFAYVSAWVIFLGNISMPLAVLLFGLGK